MVAVVVEVVVEVVVGGGVVLGESLVVDLRRWREDLDDIFALTSVIISCQGSFDAYMLSSRLKPFTANRAKSRGRTLELEDEDAGVEFIPKIRETRPKHRPVSKYIGRFSDCPGCVQPAACKDSRVL